MIGDHGVSILETTNAVVNGSTIDGVRWTYLTDGDQYDFGTQTVTRSPGSRATARSGRAKKRQNVFSSLDGPSSDLYVMRDLARTLVTSRSSSVKGLSYERRPRFKVFLQTDCITEAWETGAGNVSFSNLSVRIEPR